MSRNRGRQRREALVKNAADQEQVEYGKKVAKATEKSHIDDVYAIMQAPQGERFLAKMLSRCGVHQTSVTAECNTNQTFFLEGQRNVGLQLLSDLMEADPEKCVRIITIAKEGD